MTTPHKSSSKFQGEVEVEMLKILGKELGIPLEKKRIDYHGSKMEIDGVDADEKVFVEAFARVGILKSGQRRKVATDAFKLATLKADRPDARFILAFVDAAAQASVVGWLRTAIDRYSLELRLVEIPAHRKDLLTATQAEQKAGMEEAE